MNLQTLIEQLNHPEPKKRLIAIHILSMVDEVRALDAISHRVPVEMEAKVEKPLKRVGRALSQLKREGFDTVEAICEHFNIYSEVLSYADAAEFKDIQQMSHRVSDKRKDDNFNDQVINTASKLIASRILGPTAMMGAPAVDISSNMGSVAEAMQKLAKRVRATIPTNTDFSRWLPQLKSDDPDDRQQAIIQLNNSHNPTALQYMARMYVTDPEQRIRDTAKRLGRTLYWNTTYYEMEQDGTIDKIMKDFAASLGIALPEKTATQEMPVPPAAQESIEDILAKAENRRKKKGRRV